MKSGRLERTLVCAILLLTAYCASAAITGTDNTGAGSYSGSTWANGSNGTTNSDGTHPFGAWDITMQNNAGHFISSSTNLTGSSNPDINTGGSAFGMYGSGHNANPNHVDVTRPFSSPLASSQSFSLDIAVNYRNGSKGVDVYAGGTTKAFTFNVVSDDYKVQNTGGSEVSFPAAPGANNNYDSNTQFHIVFIQTDSSGGNWSISRKGGQTQTLTGSFNGDLTGFHMFNYDTDGNAPDALYANNFTISNTTPELSSISLFAAGGSVVTLIRRRNSAAV